MKYEVIYGNDWRIIEATTPYQACMIALQKTVLTLEDEGLEDTIPLEPFCVTTLNDKTECNTNEEIPVSEILNLLYLAINYEEDNG